LQSYYFREEFEALAEEEKDGKIQSIRELMASSIWRDYRQGFAHLDLEHGKIIEEVLMHTSEAIMSFVVKTV